MPDSPPANRLLAHAMREGSETPGEAFDRYLAEHERDPKWQARQDRIRRASAGRRLSPWRDIPPIGLAIVALLLLARWLAGLIGLVK